MGAFEVFSMVVALAIMLAALGAKILTSQLTNRMQHTSSLVTQSRQKTLGQFRLAHSQNKVAQQNCALLGRKKAKLHKKIGQLRKELSRLRGEAERRRKMRDTMRGKLMRPALAGPRTDAAATEDE